MLTETRPVLCDQCGGALDVAPMQDFAECHWCGVVLRIDRGGSEILTVVANLGMRTARLEEETHSLHQQVAQLRGDQPPMRSTLRVSSAHTQRMRRRQNEHETVDVGMAGICLVLFVLFLTGMF